MSHSDRDRIQELFARYAEAIDSKDYPAIVACFASDATAQYGDFSTLLRGHGEIEGQMRLVLENLDVTQHLFANFIIAIDGDSGRVRCGLIAQHVRFGEGGAQPYMSGGKYDVEVRRIGGDWKMLHVAAGSVWSEGNRDLLPRNGELNPVGPD